MDTMKVAVYQGIEQIGVQVVERTPPPPGYVAVEMRKSGVCGSDLHSYFGHWGQSDKFAAGHETCGVIAEVGEGVTDFEVGDRVTAECFSHCGKCDNCATGLYNHCQQRRWISHEAHGGFAEYATLHASGVFKLPKTMSFEVGAMVEPLAVSYRAVKQSAAVYPDRVAIIGGGTIGLLALAAAKAIGVRETIMAVKYPQQAQAAEAFGADHIVDVSRTSLPEAVKQATAGRGVDAVIETAGNASAFDVALSIVRKQGSVTLVAGYHKPLEVNLGRVVGSEATIRGSNCYGYSGVVTDFHASIDLISSGRVDVSQIVTHRFPLDEIREAFRVAADKHTGSIKVHLNP